MIPYDRYRLILRHDRILGCDMHEEMVEYPIMCEFLVDIRSPTDPPKTEIVQELYVKLLDFLEKKENGE